MMIHFSVLRDSQGQNQLDNPSNCDTDLAGIWSHLLKDSMLKWVWWRAERTQPHCRRLKWSKRFQVIQTGCSCWLWFQLSSSGILELETLWPQLLKESMWLRYLVQNPYCDSSGDAPWICRGGTWYGSGFSQNNPISKTYWMFRFHDRQSFVQVRTPPKHGGKPCSTPRGTEKLVDFRVAMELRAQHDAQNMVALFRNHKLFEH